MKLSAEKIQANWVDFMSNINTYISSPRKEQLIEFYETYAERIMLMPAAHKKEYHSAFPGGYRIEFEIEWLPKFKNPTQVKKDNFTIKSNKSTKTKALGNLSSPGLQNMLKNI